ncbi:thioredoxin-like protein [Paraphoma chrysanthemicola]|uniref:Thioredoxin-like protein n=1 Tax=Paraphoma chrysanthemicola TaxID=798071 RepID=A0A8K0VS22_9PLEO|nr:thioredoxin-like protein [Paraphoma chrysanthemicola]
MSALGKVRIGHKAPDFHCEAVVRGVIEDVTLSTYIHPTIKPGTAKPDLPWLILLFIPAAFSFVCPTEVLAFQNCLDEFKDRNCSVVFISVDTKHSLWHWQNVPRQYGGLGQIDIPLLSDANHRLSREYGVLIEDEGVSLRGMFIIDGEGIVQQITLNNLTVGRSVLEALRLLEAFQAVAKHGVLCPIDWKPSGDAADTLNTISNTLAESYDERLANLQKEFEGVLITDLDAKHKTGDTPETDPQSSTATKNPEDVSTTSESANVHPTRSHSNSQPPTIQEVTCERPKLMSPNANSHNDCLPHLPSSTNSYDSMRSVSNSSSTVVTPSIAMPSLDERKQSDSTARHSRGTSSSRRRKALDSPQTGSLFSQPAPSIFQSLLRTMSSTSTSTTDTSSGYSSAPPTPGPLSRRRSTNSTLSAARLKMHNTYESRTGSHVVLEFADPTLSPHGSPLPFPLSRSSSWQGPDRQPRSSSVARSSWGRTGTDGAKDVQGNPPSQTRLQATFETLKKFGQGLGTPRADYSPRKTEGARNGGEAGKDGEDGRMPGYFDVVVDEADER